MAWSKTAPFPERGVLRHQDGQAVAYERLPGAVADELPALLLVNGLLSDRTGRKASEVRSLAHQAGCEALLFDCRAHGESCTGPQQLLSLGPLDFMHDTLLVLDSAVQSKRVVVIGGTDAHGSSLGAWVAALAALCRPQRVAGLLLLAPAMDMSERHWAGLGVACQQLALHSGLVSLHSPYVSTAAATPATQSSGGPEPPQGPDDRAGVAAAAVQRAGDIVLGLPFITQGAALQVLQRRGRGELHKEGWPQVSAGVADAARAAGLPPALERLAALRRVPRVHIVHGDQDNVVPLEVALELFLDLVAKDLACGPPGARVSSLDALVAAAPGLEVAQVSVKGADESQADLIRVRGCSGQQRATLWVMHGGDHRLSGQAELQHMRDLVLDLLR